MGRRTVPGRAVKPTADRSRSEHSRRILVLVGPTASGKTTVSLLVARKLNGEVISADSRQIFRRLDLGTAKPSPEERSLVKHYFVDDLDPDQDFNAGQYGIRGREIIEDLFRRGKVPLVVGGSGLYVKALVDGFFEGVSPDPEIRRELSARLREEGPQALLDELERVDPFSASRMLPTNTRRIVRALEVYRSTGTTISELQNSRIEIKFRPVFAGLQWDRQVLYARIDRRVDWMIRQGLVEEVTVLRDRGLSPTLNALQTPGYREVFAYLQGSIDFAEMVSLVKRSTRRYAKRQLTWFRRDKRIRWFEARQEGDLPRIADRICSFFMAS